MELALPGSGEHARVESPGDESILPSKTMMETYALYRQGISIADIASRRECTPRTIEGHLADCVRAGLGVDVSQFVSDTARGQIENVIAKHGADKLKPIRDALPENITYPQIRFVIADLQRAGKL